MDSETFETREILSCTLKCNAMAVRIIIYERDGSSKPHV
jgi:hypothetical protein